MSEELDTPFVERAWQHGGFDCLVIRGPLGYRCGYVRLPDGHPWHGLDRDDPSPVQFPDDGLETLEDIDIFSLFGAALGMDEGFAQSVQAQVRIHGGLNFMCQTNWEPVLGDAPAGFWIGFDCGHAGDEMEPDSAHGRLMHKIREDLGHPQSPGHVWTTQEVATECHRLVEQVVAAQAIYEAQTGGNMASPREDPDEAALHRRPAP